MRSRWVVGAAAAAGCCAPTARAFDRFWNSFSSGNFADTARWVGGAVPVAGDTAFFRVFGGGTPGPYTVTFRGQQIILGPRNYVNATLRVGPNTVTLNQSFEPFLGPSTYALTSAVEIGEGTGASVLNTGLPVTALAARVGHLAGSPATLNVNASTFAVTGSGTNTAMFVGGSVAGTVNVNGGAALNVTGTGDGHELFVGYGAPGTVNVNAGGLLNVTSAQGSAVVGARAGVGGVVNVSGAGAAWHNSGDQFTPLVVGGAGAGALNVTAGGTVDNHTAWIGGELGGSGAVTVSGAGSGWTNRGQLWVGEKASGFLAITGGGRVTADSAFVGAEPQSSGVVQVTGAGSLWSQAGNLTVGGHSSSTQIGNGNGTLNVTGGGRVVTGGVGSVLLDGTVQVSGAGSSWSVNDLQVGSGAVHVLAGGTVAANVGRVIGQVNVGGAGSGLTFADWVSVGTSAIGATSTAVVRVVDGGRAEARVAYIGGGLGGIGGRGALFLDNPNSTWEACEHLYVGFIGLGEVTVARGARLVSGGGQLGVSPNSLGTVLVDGAGSRWDNANALSVGVGGSARVTVSAGGVVASGGPLSVGPRGVVEGNSTVAAHVQNGGIVAPGVSANIIFNDFLGTLSINGNYAQTAGGRFAVEIGSTALHDRLNVSGNAAIDGTLSTTLVNGFVPTPGDRFTVLSAAQRTGTFQQSASLGPGSVFLVPLYTPTEVILLAAAAGTKTWGVDAGGNASAGSNWLGGAAPVSGAGGVDDKIAFTTVISANRTVTVDAPFTAGAITFDDDNDYAVQGPGPVTMEVSSGNAVITARGVHGNGRHTIAAPLHLASRTGFDVQDPDGLLTVTEQMTAAPAVLVGKAGPGTLEVKNVRAEGLFVMGGTVRMARDGGPGGTSLVSQFAMGPGGRLDLEDNDLVISYAATGATPYNLIRTLVIAGLTTNTGIVSTAGQAAGNTVHAVVESARIGATSWNGLGIDDDESVIVAYALRGDANVDGTVDFLDLVAVAQNYNNATGLAYWDMGDFTYDGNVDFNDLVAVAQNYNASMPSGPVPGAPAGFAGELAAAFAAVPEPSLVGGLCLVGYGLTARRRRRARSA